MEIALPRNIETILGKLEHYGFRRNDCFFSIRFKHYEHNMLFCPITACCLVLTNKAYESGNYQWAAAKINLSDEHRWIIQRASDFDEDSNREWLESILTGVN